MTGFFFIIDGRTGIYQMLLQQMACSEYERYNTKMSWN